MDLSNQFRKSFDLRLPRCSLLSSSRFLLLDGDQSSSGAGGHEVDLLERGNLESDVPVRENLLTSEVWSPDINIISDFTDC